MSLTISPEIPGVGPWGLIGCPLPGPRARCSGRGSGGGSGAVRALRTGAGGTGDVFWRMIEGWRRKWGMRARNASEEGFPAALAISTRGHANPRSRDHPRPSRCKRHADPACAVHGMHWGAFGKAASRKRPRSRSGQGRGGCGAHRLALETDQQLSVPVQSRGRRSGELCRDTWGPQRYGYVARAAERFRGAETPLVDRRSQAG